MNRSNEVLNFNQYLVMTETNLNICDHKNALKRVYGRICGSPGIPYGIELRCDDAEFSGVL